MDTGENTYDMQFKTAYGDSSNTTGNIYIAPQRVRVQIGTDAAIVLGGPIDKNGDDYYYTWEVPVAASYLVASGSAILAASAMLLF